MNKIMLIGRLTHDPEVRHTTTTNKSFCQFRLAVNRKYSKLGEPQADFFSVIAWGKLSDFCGNYLCKGQQIAVIGKLQNRTWDDSEGKRHYITEVIAQEITFADSKKAPYNANDPESIQTSA